ncbi:unnamed protein product, partial [Polarella glacialis]
ASPPSASSSGTRLVPHLELRQLSQEKFPVKKAVPSPSVVVRTLASERTVPGPRAPRRSPWSSSEASPPAPIPQPVQRLRSATSSPQPSRGRLGAPVPSSPQVACRGVNRTPPATSSAVSRQSSTESAKSYQRPAVPLRSGSRRKLDLTSTPVPPTFGSASECWNTLGLVAPFRDVLCSVLGQPKSVAGGVFGPPPRRSPGAKPPSERDLQKLREACGTMVRSIETLQRSFQEAPAVETEPDIVKGADGGTGGAMLSLASSCADETSDAADGPDSSRPIAQLEEACSALRVDTLRLQASSSRVADLESVASQLRGRVAVLEAEDARTAALRDECHELRIRIAELVTSSVDRGSVQGERDDLQARWQRLSAQQSGVPGPAPPGGHKDMFMDCPAQSVAEQVAKAVVSVPTSRVPSPLK